MNNEMPSIGVLIQRIVVIDCLISVDLPVASLSIYNRINLQNEGASRRVHRTSPSTYETLDGSIHGVLQEDC